MHRRLSQVDSELTIAKQRLNILEQSSEVATSPWKQKKVPWYDLSVSFAPLCRD